MLSIEKIPEMMKKLLNEMEETNESICKELEEHTSSIDIFYILKLENVLKDMLKEDTLTTSYQGLISLGIPEEEANSIIEEYRDRCAKQLIKLESAKFLVKRLE